MSLKRRALAGLLFFVCCHNAQADAIVSELRTGGMYHDAGILGNRKESGADINGEILFSSPRILRIIGAPRPDIGATYNLWGKTSQVYTGITWDYKFLKHYFAEFSFGPSLNNGHLNKSQDNWKDLGSPILFRESLSLGIRFNKHHDVSMYMDHISNAGIAKYNGGMETVGLRYGYCF